MGELFSGHVALVSKEFEILAGDEELSEPRSAKFFVRADGFFVGD